MIDHRLRLFDRVSGVDRACVVMSVRSATVATAMNQRRSILRAQSVGQFAPEIAANSRSDAVAHIVDYTLSIENIDYLRSCVGLSRSRTRHTLSTALRLALT